MAIEISSGGVTKTYRYYPYDAFYVDTSGNVNTSGQGQQVREAWFNGVKYYPEDYTIASIRIVSTPPGLYVVSSNDYDGYDSNYQPTFDEDDVVVEAVCTDGNTFILPHDELNLGWSGNTDPDYLKLTSSYGDVFATNVGGCYVGSTRGASGGSIIAGDLDGSNWMKPRLFRHSIFVIDPSDPTTLRWVGGYVAQGRLYESSQPSGAVGSIRAMYRPDNYDSGIRYLYASHRSNYDYATYKGQEVTLAYLTTTFSASNFGVNSFFDLWFDVPVNVTSQDPMQLLMNILVNNPFYYVKDIVVASMKEDYRKSASDYLNNPVFNYLTS